MLSPSTLETTPAFTQQALALDVAVETERIVAWLRQSVLQNLRRQGATIAISGGIDSSVVLALCIKAFGPERVLGVLLPEKESSAEIAELALQLAAHFGAQSLTEDITEALEGVGCYRRRDEAMRRVFPAYGDGWKAKIVLPGNLLDKATLNVFSLTVIDPRGESFTKRLPPREYSQIVAATNFKQRMRMAMLYYHADARNYAVIGTANKNEYDLGFFVKHGDGGVDVSPIVHLFKTQVYQVARHLDVPQAIQQRTPTTDTYSASSTQEEFFFRLPFEVLDMIWLGYEKGYPTQAIATALQLAPEQIERVIADIGAKQRATAYLRQMALNIQ